jgi:DNA primase
VVRAIESPQLLEQAREAATRAVFDDPDVSAIRDAAFYVLDNTESLDRHAVAAHLRSLGRKRAVDLLETMPVRQPMDPRSGEGRDWLLALERFPVATTIAGEARSTVQGDDDIGGLSAAHEARIRAMMAERRRASRSVVDEAAASLSDDGVQRLRAALGVMDAAMERSRSED